MANKKLMLDVGRQAPLFGEITFDFAHITDTAIGVKAILLPYGAQVIGGSLIVDNAFNPGTSLTLKVGDAVKSDRYLAAGDLKTAGITPLVPTGYVSDGGPIMITPALTGGAATQGSARLSVQYVIKGRAGEVQPN